MKIIQFYDSFFPRLGGVARHIANITDFMKDINFEVITPRIPNTQETEKFTPNCAIRRFNPVKQFNDNPFSKKLEIFNHIAKDIIRQRKMNNYLKKADYDVFHSHAPCHSFPLFRWDKKLLKRYLLSKSLLPKTKKPTLLTIHHLYFGDLDFEFEKDPFKNGYFRHLIENSERLILIEHYSYDYLKYYLQKYGFGQKIYKIHNSIDTSAFSYKENNPEKRLKVLFAGRLTSEKGTDLISQLIAKLPGNIDLYIAASGSEEDLNLIERVVKKRKNIFLHKNVNLPGLTKLYHKCNVIFNPVLFEGISRVTLEAMASGRPVIMVDKGSRHPVIDGKTGFLIKEDINALIKLLSELDDDKEKLIKTGKNARILIEKEFSNDIIIPKIKKIYKEMA